MHCLLLKVLIKNVGSNFERLQQIVLNEEFKNCIHSEIRTYLNEQKVETLEQAATAADDYVLTHKVSFVKPGQQKMTTCKSQSYGSQGGLETSQVSSSKLDYSAETGKDRVSITRKLLPWVTKRMHEKE